MNLQRTIARILEAHLKGALKEILPSGQFPTPVHLNDYMAWDDWRVLGELSAGHGGDHGDRLRSRHHYRQVFHTRESEDLPSELARLAAAKTELGPLLADEVPAKSSWYKTGHPDIPVRSNINHSSTAPLSSYSPIVANMKQINQVLLYVRPEDVAQAKMKLVTMNQGQP